MAESVQASAGSASEISIGRGAGINLGVRFASYLLLAVSSVLLSRSLGAHDRGVYSLITVIATYAGLMELGISQGGVYLAGQRFFSLSDVAANNMAFIMLISAIWLAGSLAAALLQPEFLPGALSAGHYLVIGVAGSLLLYIGVARDLVIASGRVVAFSIIDFAEPLARSILITAGVLLFGFGLSGVLLCWVAGLIFTALLALSLAARRVRLLPAFHAGLLGREVSFGWRNTAAYIVQGINSRLDVFIVAYFLGHAALGSYAVAFSLAEMLWQIPFAVSLMLFPKATAQGLDGAAETASVTCRRVLFVTLGAVAGAMLAGQWVLSIYGSEFQDGLTAYYILTPSALFYCVYKVLGTSLAARGRPECGLFSALAALPVTVMLGLFAIPRFGIEGAALTSLIAYGINASVTLVLFCRATGYSVRDTLLVRPEDVRLARRFVLRGASQ